MELVCGFDVETTGFDAKKDFITEIGAILFNAQTWEVQKTFSQYVSIPIAVPPEITKLTGITDETLKRDGIPLENAILRLESFADTCLGFVAHNAQFDKSFYDESSMRALGRIGIVRPWLCTLDEVDHGNKKCRVLSHLAVDYGLTVDGSKAHGALYDVQLMGSILKQTGKSYWDLREYADIPWVYLKANVGYNDRELAKADGFRWEKYDYGSPVFTKTWVKKIKQDKVEDEKARQVGFQREVINNPGK